MIEADFALFNVGQLVTGAPGSHPSAEGDLGVVPRAAVAARGGKIAWIGSMDDVEREVMVAPSATVVNTHGRTVLPGFVDPHTHPVFAGTRAGDFYARALGESYAQQLGSGGIRQTIAATRAASDDTLLEYAYRRADGFLAQGTTTIEAKTGYGLTEHDELRSLAVLNRLQRLHPLKIVPAFLGAHVVPPEFDGDADAYVEAIEQWLPAARDRAQFVDVWMDDGAFSVEQGARILQRARDLGFQLTAHANEMGPHGGAKRAAELGARSVDHLNYLDDSDITALRDAETVAVLLPGTTLFIGSDQYSPARQLLDAGVPVALGTDFNPGTCFTQSMQLILTLAVLKLHMTAEEAIRGATAVAARAVGMDDLVGTLEVGKFCDFSVFRTSHYRDIPYHMGENMVETVVAGGQVVVRDGTVVHPRTSLVTAT